MSTILPWPGVTSWTRTMLPCIDADPHIVLGLAHRLATKHAPVISTRAFLRDGDWGFTTKAQSHERSRMGRIFGVSLWLGVFVVCFCVGKKKECCGHASPDSGFQPQRDRQHSGMNCSTGAAMGQTAENQRESYQLTGCFFDVGRSVEETITRRR